MSQESIKLNVFPLLSDKGLTHGAPNVLVSDKLGLQAREFINLDSSTTEPWCYNPCRIWFVRQHVLFWTCRHGSAFMETSQTLVMPSPSGILALDQSQSRWLLSFLEQKTQYPCFSERPLKTNLSDPGTYFCFIVSNGLGPREGTCVSIVYVDKLLSQAAVLRNNSEQWFPLLLWSMTSCPVDKGVFFWLHLLVHSLIYSCTGGHHLLAVTQPSVWLQLLWGNVSLVWTLLHV